MFSAVYLPLAMIDKRARRNILTTHRQGHNAYPQCVQHMKPKKRHTACLNYLLEYGASDAAKQGKKYVPYEKITFMSAMF